jgi:hypothetical protein
MRQHYKDILDRIGVPPTWFDEYGVPRFGKFSPRHLANIHASEAALANVACRRCGRLFRVALTEAFGSKGFGLGDQIRLRRVQYGDPPNIDCCVGGASVKSEMREILEYWSRDYEVSRDWQRDPTFEGPVAAAPLDPPDTVAEVLAAVASGARAILVMCTSRWNRYDLAGRITAAMARDGRVLVAYQENYSTVARMMLDGLVPDADVGHRRDDRTVMLAEFSHLNGVQLPPVGSIVILAGPRPRDDATQKAWSDVATRLATEADDKTRIEFALAHSSRMIANPDVVVDAGRTRTGGVEEKAGRSP